MGDIPFKEEDTDIDPAVEKITITFKGGKTITYPDILAERHPEAYKTFNPLNLFVIVVAHDGLRDVVSWKGGISPFVLSDTSERLKAMARYIGENQVMTGEWINDTNEVIKIMKQRIKDFGG